MWQMSKSKRLSTEQTKSGSPESLDIQQAPTEKINRLLLFFHRKRKPKVCVSFHFHFRFRFMWHCVVIFSCVCGFQTFPITLNCYSFVATNFSKSGHCRYRSDVPSLGNKLAVEMIFVVLFGISFSALTLLVVSKAEH